MIPVTSFAGKTVAVFGLARTGITAVQALEAGGARVIAWDDAQAGRDRAVEAGITPKDLSQADWSSIAALVMSPGVPVYGPKAHWSALKAEELAVPVIGDVELLARELNRLPQGERPLVVAITGTNGKSTTTALIAHILTACGRDVRLGGNIGTGILSLAPPRPGAIYVLELSSYQLDLAHSLRCDVAVHLNLAPDHLERHGTMARYAAAKRRIFSGQTRTDTAIVGVDDDWGEALATRFIAEGKRITVPVSSGQTLSRGVFAVGGTLWDATEANLTEVLDLTGLAALPGAHNGQNIAAAFAAVRALGLPRGAIAAAIATFPGLKHRLQKVGQTGPISFYNDSKATNAEAAAQALAAFPRLRWIAGGRPKTDGIDALAPFFPRITKAYLIGEAAAAFATTLAGKAPAELSGTLESAVASAIADARASGQEERIVLSPACASFDQYPDFEARGDHFITLVQDILNHADGESRPAAAAP
jgi:UDP-N-acetylmuramoylalanine--D-glutamate ligase